MPNIQCGIFLAIFLILMKYVPLEERELTPVDSDTISDLAMLALQAETLDEVGKVVQATLPKNVPVL